MRLFIPWVFDSKFYLENNQDVKDSGISPLKHYMKVGRNEGRKPYAGAKKRNMGLIGKWFSYSRVSRPHYTYQKPSLTVHVQQELQSFAKQPLISIIIPVYNVDPKWLDCAIESVRKQWYPHWQICIADDNSDNPLTVKYLDKLEMEQDSKLSICRAEENKHISTNSNRALHLAKG